ncbi:bifunctional precorrin-2 dehydrogenase/sirohydrochlorin ferrochelatase [Candidatus Binatia bacterium]|nr:bifunctional precorrin-2 dehydrogenase/sirohydrochlorin ferrochelatase [Candidatus Binatia bacterium]
MDYYPIYLRLDARPCLVVGGGEVAARKVHSLLAAGAAVTVVAPRLCAELQALSEAGTIACVARTFSPGDTAGCALVYAATADTEVNRAVFAAAEAAGVLVNVVDQPHLCRFVAPAVVSRGALTVAISTGGASPAMAGRLRRELEATIGPEYAIALRVLGRLRSVLRIRPMQPGDRQRILRTLADSALLDLVRAGDAAGIDRLLADTVGSHCSLATLGVSLDTA